MDEVDECRDATASGPAAPSVECFDAGLALEHDDVPQSFPWGDRRVEPWFGLRDPDQFGVLVLGVLPQFPA